jgi:hypothetical protein
MKSKIQNPRNKQSAGLPKSKIVPATDGSAIKSFGPGPRFNLGPSDPQLAIAKLILNHHQGADAAITIKGIAEELWPTEWWFIKNDSTGHPTYPLRAKRQRDIKGWISDLVTVSKEMIVSNRGHKTPGYYVPVTQEEIDAAALTFLRQALKMILRANALKKSARYQELAGQLTLLVDGMTGKESGDRAIGSSGH